MATFRSAHNIDKTFKKCPYDPNHLVPANRMPLHIAKCQQTSSKVLEVCPFNASHRLTKVEMQTHLGNCPMRTNLINPQLDEPPSILQFGSWELTHKQKFGRVQEHKIKTEKQTHDHNKSAIDEQRGQREMAEDADSDWD